jgi:uncharacterized protein (DUF924 family)
MNEETKLDPRAEEVLRFWLAEAGEGAPLTPSMIDRWFAGGPALDREIEARFGAEIDAACRGERDAWAATPRGRLALVIVLDQFTRNPRRDQAAAFAGDARALALARAAVVAGEDAGLLPVERYFLYMPFMHAEEMEAQHESVALFQRLAGEGRPEDRPVLESAVGYALDHRDTVARFGRFPARNAALGRATTAEEQRHLEALAAGRG